MDAIIDYKIFCDDMQFVEMELDPSEGIRAEVGAMMYMDDGIEMQTTTRVGLPWKVKSAMVSAEPLSVASLSGTKLICDK